MVGIVRAVRTRVFLRSAITFAATVFMALGSSALPASAARCEFTNEVLASQSVGAVQITAPNAALLLDVAYSEAQRERGLMYRTKLAKHHGMVFVYDRNSERHFWMKNMKIPLDMVFILPDGAVSEVYKNVVPDTTDGSAPPIYSAGGCAVIELPVGEAAMDGIAFGRKLRVVSGRR